jgi:hypothetical protein
MNNRQPGYRFTIFGKDIYRHHLNWFNLASFITCAIANHQLRVAHDHPKDDHHSDTIAEHAVLLIALVNLITSFPINMSGFWPQSQTAPIVPLQSVIAEETISATLQKCLERAKDIENLLNEIKPDQMANCPEKYLCPINLTPMKCPVVASDGKIYEYETILEILHTTQKSPLTRERLTLALNPFPHLQNKIHNWAQEQIEKTEDLSAQYIATKKRM